MSNQTGKTGLLPESDTASLLPLLRENSSFEIKLKEPVSLYTSFKIGGPCKALVIPRTEQHVKWSLRHTSNNSIPLAVIGNGTNILVSDKGFEGIIMRISEPYFSEARIRGSTVKIGAGISISTLADILIKKGLCGLEFITGIPGTVGGAIVMNAGSQGKRIGETVARVRVMSRESKTYWLSNKEIEFGYRRSRFSNTGEVVLGAEIKLKKGDPDSIASEVRKISKEREAKLPLELPSAGCIFKNPPDNPAGKLIELAGCKGLRVGGAQVSTKHANFIVNVGAATCKDVETLIGKVQKRVYQNSKVSLEPEIVCL